MNIRPVHVSVERALRFNQEENLNNRVDKEYWDWADNAEGGLEHIIPPATTSFSIPTA